MVTMGKIKFIKEKQWKCPKCGTELTENDINDLFFDCSKCGLKITKSDLKIVMYCKSCDKLYADVNSYNDHILFCKQEMIVNG